MTHISKGFLASLKELSEKEKEFKSTNPCSEIALPESSRTTTLSGMSIGTIDVGGYTVRGTLTVTSGYRDLTGIYELSGGGYTFGKIPMFTSELWWKGNVKLEESTFQFVAIYLKDKT